MVDTWVVVEWVQLVVALLFLIFVVGILYYVIRHYGLEFNQFWQSRCWFTGWAFIWVFSLLLGRDQLWGADGLIPVSEHVYHNLCQAYVFLTFGLSQPLFFLTILLFVREPLKARSQLYGLHPNITIMRWTLIWSAPIIVVHLIVVGANSAITETYQPFWSTYDNTYNQCVIPIISTLAFTAFYAVFLGFYIFYSNKLWDTLINKKLQKRARVSQFSFSLFFPFEVLIRIILIFITQFKVASEILSHALFFIDLIICIVGVLEFAMLPVWDASEYPLLSGITGIPYHKFMTFEIKGNKVLDEELIIEEGNDPPQQKKTGTNDKQEISHQYSAVPQHVSSAGKIKITMLDDDDFSSPPANELSRSQPVKYS